MMWKLLNHGEMVSVGETLRFRSNSNSLLPEDQTYLVVRTDQHYFEIIEKKERRNIDESPRRKVVRYIDIGYNVVLERLAD